MRRNYILAEAVVVCLLCGLGLQAQQSDSSASDNTNLSPSSQPAAGTVPRLIKFTGAVKDLTGKVPTGVVALTFSLYELSEGGSPLWVETQSLTLDSLGHYTALLGTNSPEGLPLDLFTSSKALWLGVQAQLPGQPEQPRVLLVAVPYALKSSDADTLGGLPASAYMLSANANTAPGSSVTPLITLPSPILGAPPTSAPITGAGTANFAAMFTGAATIGNSLLYNSPRGFVGIGTTNPAAMLDVHGTGNFTGALNLAQTTGADVGVINLGGNSFIHACCPKSQANTFVGTSAGNFAADATGSHRGYGVNTATGFQALQGLTSGYENTAHGFQALYSNTTGSDNTANGNAALTNNTTGGSNVAIGSQTGQFLQSGSSNILVGSEAGRNFTSSESNNIDIGNQGIEADSGVIRIGTGGTQTKSFIAGVTGVTPGGASPLPVIIDSNGQLGTGTPALGTVTSVGSGAGLTGGPITTSGTLSVATGGVTNAMLQNPSLTVSAGTGLTGGGAVSLGGSTTLSLNPNISATTGVFSGSTSPVVSGTNTGNSSYGQLGTSVSGNATGVYGNGSYYGVYGGSAVIGVTGSGGAMGVYGLNSSNNSYGELGGTISGGATGVYGSGSSYGVYGNSSSFGVLGAGGTYGVYGTSGSSVGYGVYGSNTVTSGIAYGVYGTSASSGGSGVYGMNASNGSYGQLGTIVAGYAAGVYGSASGSGTYGVYGSGGTIGVYGNSSGYGVYGSSSGFGLHGSGSTGVDGYSNNSTNGIGVDGYVNGTGSGAYAVWGQNAGSAGYAGYFTGNLNVTGAITAGTKDFLIDHPLNPADKYLYHASVESSEMMNIYTGNAKLDSSGEAVVELPEWFEAVNADFRYQLTAIGAPAPGLYIAEEIADHHFKIAGGPPGTKVSWQVTGVRQDAYAKAHPLQVEVDKPEKERGYYIHPELYGQPKEKGIDWARHPQEMRQLESGTKPPEPAGGGVR